MKINLYFLFHCILLTSLILFFCSCKKLQGEGWTKVEGQAVDKYTGEPVPFARIKVETTAGGFTPIPGSGTAKEKIADANGKFEFSFEADSENDYQLTGYLEDRYFRPEYPIDLNAARKNKNLKLKLQPLAWAKIKVINEPPLDTAWLHVRSFHGDENGLNYFNLDGISRDTIVVRTINANISQNLIFRVKKNGPYNYSYIPVTPKTHDTTSIEFRY